MVLVSQAAGDPVLFFDADDGYWKLYHPARSFAWKPGSGEFLWQGLTATLLSITSHVLVSVSGQPVKTPDGLGFEIVKTYADGSSLTIKLFQPNLRDADAKLSLDFTVGTLGLVTLEIGLDGVALDAVITGKKLTLPSRRSVPRVFSWEDVAIPLAVTRTGLKLSLTLSIALAPGSRLSLDPTYDGGGGGTSDDPESLRYSGKRLFGKDADKFEKLWLITGNVSGNCKFIFSNNGGTSFTVQDMGSTTAITGGCSAVAYDKTNDQFLLAFGVSPVDPTPHRVKFVRGTITRDGSNNITGHSLGTVLTFTETPTGARIRDVDAWHLDNGEAGVVWTVDSPGPTPFTSQTRFSRITYASPPVRKNLAGTTGATDNVGTNVNAESVSYCNLAQDPFDAKLHAFWIHRHGAAGPNAVYHRASGALGGSWSAEVEVRNSSSGFPDFPDFDHRLQMMAGLDNAFKPQVLLSLVDDITPGNFAKIYGMTDGAGHAQLNGNQYCQRQDQAFPTPTALAMANAETRKAVHVFVKVLSGPLRFDISFVKWDAGAGSWDATSTLIIQEGPGFNLLGGIGAKAVRSDLLEVFYALKNSSTLVWEQVYQKFDFAPVTPPVAGAAGARPPAFFDIARRAFETGSAVRLRRFTEMTSTTMAGERRQVEGVDRSRSALVQRETVHSPARAGVLHRVFRGQSSKLSPVHRVQQSLERVLAALRLEMSMEEKATVELQRKQRGESGSSVKVLRQILQRTWSRAGTRTQVRAETSITAETEDDLSLITEALEEDE